MSSSYVAVFPGQGSQRVGMLAAAAESNPTVNELFARASEVLGYDLWALSQHGPQEELNLTETTQPLILTASVAIWQIWRANGAPAPEFMAGHSLGEFSALVCADSLEFEDAVALVRNRGRYMQTAVPVGVGSMAAILGLDDETIAQACAVAAQGEVVEAVNLNAPGQVVIAGHASAVERAIEECKSRGAKRAMPLPVSAPFHTSLMQPAGEQLAGDLSSMRIRAPSIPVIHNVHAEPEQDPERIRSLLTKQIHSPVQWVRSMQYARQQGVSSGVEIGPGKVLSGLCKRIERDFEGLSTEEPADLAKSLDAVKG